MVVLECNTLKFCYSPLFSVSEREKETRGGESLNDLKSFYIDDRNNLKMDFEILTFTIFYNYVLSVTFWNKFVALKKLQKLTRSIYINIYNQLYNLDLSISTGNNEDLQITITSNRMICQEDGCSEGVN